MNQGVRPPRSHNPAIPESLDTIVCKSLNKESAQRYPTALSMAEDLMRFLSAQRIRARRLGYLYRVGYWARRKPAIAALTVALLLSLIGLIGYGMQTRIQSAIAQRTAQRDAELARLLGQTIKDLEWRMRTDYLLPLHDIEEEKTLVREQMTQIDHELRAAGAHGVRLAHYALGRGHLSLHEWDAAQRHLQEAERLGLVDRELDYALGRVLGQRYSIALDEARKSGDKTFLEKRKLELERELLAPARRYLERSRALNSVAPSYVEALVDFYHQRYDSALINAQFAQKQQRRLYEATKLEADVYMVRALELKDRGEYDAAERTFLDAIARYERAAETGRSDPRLHEAIAEAYVRLEEVDQETGRDPTSHLRQALAAADRALECAPHDSNGQTKKAYAYMFAAVYAQGRGEVEQAKALFAKQIEAGKAAITLNKNDAYAFEMIGVAYEMTAMMKLAAGNMAIKEDIQLAEKYFSEAIRINNKFVWAYNDLAAMLNNYTLSLPRTDPLIEISIRRALELSEKSLDADENQAAVYQNISQSYIYLADWKIERGESTIREHENAKLYAEKSLSINQKSFYIHGNIGLMYITMAAYLMDRGEDGTSAANQAKTHLEKLIQVNDKYIASYGWLATTYYWLARHAIAQKQSPNGALAGGRQTINRCNAIDAAYPPCQIGQALLLAAEAEWLDVRQPIAAAPVMRRALALAAAAVKQTPTDRELLLPLAQLSLQALTTTGYAAAERAATLDSGLSAVTSLLSQSPGWPRVLAIQAALLWTGRDVLHTEAATSGRQHVSELFQQAFAGNALLRNRFGQLARESTPTDKD